MSMKNVLYISSRKREVYVHDKGEYLCSLPKNGAVLEKLKSCK